MDGTLHQTWSRVGVQPRVPTRGERKTAHVFGALSIEGDWTWWFAPVFNGHTFHVFLQMLVEHHAGRKVFLVVDNGPCHWLDDAGKRWLGENTDKVEIHRYGTPEEREAGWPIVPAAMAGSWLSVGRYGPRADFYDRP